MARIYLIFIFLFVTWSCTAAPFESHVDAQRELGSLLFKDRSLSADGSVACSSCHEPSHAFADEHALSTGAFGRVGTRNAPSLLTATDASVYFWDGRRSRLKDAVIDPFFTPFELALSGERELLNHLDNPNYRALFTSAFPADPVISIPHVEVALVAYLKSIRAKSQTTDEPRPTATPANARRISMGKQLFFSKAQCNLCHAKDSDHNYFSDNQFHPSALGTMDIANKLPKLVALTMSYSNDPRAIGRLSGKRRGLGELGRFLVDRKPAHINAFRTPSLLDVSDTAPYMHDGSIKTLKRAVEVEVYYRSLESGHPLQLTSEEKAEIVLFLETLRTQ